MVLTRFFRRGDKINDKVVDRGNAPLTTWDTTHDVGSDGTAGTGFRRQTYFPPNNGFGRRWLWDAPENAEGKKPVGAYILKSREPGVKSQTRFLYVGDEMTIPSPDGKQPEVSLRAMEK